MDNVEREQAEHHSFAKGKLESIETQALKTNGRVTKNEDDIETVKSDVRAVKVIYSTLATVLGIAWAGITFFI